jgi:hypothetical protein
VTWPPCWSFLDILTDTISQVENRTGYNLWSIRMFGSAEGDFSSLSAEMSIVAMNFAELSASAKFVRGMLERIQDPEYKSLTKSDDFINCIEMIGSGWINKKSTWASFKADRTINGRCNSISSRLKMPELAIEVTQDPWTLADAGKLDSSSMTTLAAVSVVFLPGTLVASFFAMPLSGFNGSSMSVSSHFWIYWMVTIPLTATTILVWYVSIDRKRRLID